MSSLVFVVGAVLAGAYGAVWTLRPVSLGRSLIKTGATLALLGAGMLAQAPGLVLLALAAGGVGDWFLSRDSRGFLPGLSCFALGHGVYLAWVLPQVGGVSGGALWGMAALLALAAGLLGRIWPGLGALRGPVAGYVGLSLALGAAALLLPGEMGLVRWGVLAFIASDVILAVALFVLPPAHPRQALAARGLWALYWGGQAMILGGALGL